MNRSWNEFRNFQCGGALLNDQQLEVIRISYHPQKLSQTHILYNQLVYLWTFCGGSGRCDVMESGKLQGSTTLIRKGLMSFILEPRDHFIRQLITLREESLCAGFGRLISLNIKILTQAQTQYFTGSENSGLESRLKSKRI
jgi:hypothetical protein